MASLRQIRRRMKSIESIHEITKAMEMIAAFRFKKAEDRFRRCRAYFLEMEELAAGLSAASDQTLGPFFEKRGAKKKTLVVLSGDKGLCGAYNANLFRLAAGWLRENARFEAALVPIGKIGCDYFKKHRLPIFASYPVKSADRETAEKMVSDLKRLFLTGGTDSVELLYTVYRPGTADKNGLEPFLPLDYLARTAPKGRAGQDYLYEPSRQEVFSVILEKFLEARIYLCLLESLTSEHLARMVAMRQATENGEEVLDDLQLLHNKTRQTTITRELSEIVGGANALV